MNYAALSIVEGTRLSSLPLPPYESGPKYKPDLKIPEYKPALKMKP